MYEFLTKPNVLYMVSSTVVDKMYVNFSNDFIVFIQYMASVLWLAILFQCRSSRTWQVFSFSPFCFNVVHHSRIVKQPLFASIRPRVKGSRGREQGGRGVIAVIVPASAAR